MTRRRGVLLADVFLLAVFAYGAWTASSWPFDTALLPVSTAVLGMVLFGGLIVRELLRARRSSQPRDVPSLSDIGFAAQAGSTVPRAALLLVWVLLFAIGVSIVGFFVMVPVSVVCYLHFANEVSWRKSLAVALVLLAFVYGVYDQLMHVSWPTTLISR